NAELNYYYPTKTLVTAPEIIFFWVARMVMAGEEYLKKIPFEKVYFTGIVRDKQGRKMSKSLGNSPDLLALIDEWGTDAVRFSVNISSPAGNDLLYDEGMLLQGRNFCNKMWNATKLLKVWEERTNAEAPNSDAQFAVQWINARIDQTSETINKLFDTFQLSETLKTLYSLIWDDYCSWYLEWVKPAQGANLSQKTYQDSITVFERLLQLLHPFLPFVTEEIYQVLKEREIGDDLMVLQLAATTNADEKLLQQGMKLQQIITAIRDARAKAGLKPKDPIDILVNAPEETLYKERQETILRQTNSQQLSFTKEAVEGAISLVLQNDKLYLQGEQKVDTGVQKEALQKEMNHLQGFLRSVEQKLNNEKFVNNAKQEVVDLERKKQSDTLSRIQTIAESLALL
ncbi:MAG: class I tRNA ligase family protein, partial [Chitinophagaceae bacterium]